MGTGGTSSRESRHSLMVRSPIVNHTSPLTLATAERNIAQIAIALHLSEVVRFAALRLYTLAVEHKFTKGRKSMNVAAVCLYVACRQKETRQYMLIDFSDILEVCAFLLSIPHDES